MHPTLQWIFTRNACFFIVVLKYSHYVRKEHSLSTITAVAAKNEERFARPIKQCYTIPYLRMHGWREILPWDCSKPRFFLRVITWEWIHAHFWPIVIVSAAPRNTTPTHVARTCSRCDAMQFAPNVTSCINTCTSKKERSHRHEEHKLGK